MKESTHLMPKEMEAPGHNFIAELRSGMYSVCFSDESKNQLTFETLLTAGAVHVSDLFTDPDDNLANLIIHAPTDTSSPWEPHHMPAEDEQEEHRRAAAPPPEQRPLWVLNCMRAERIYRSFTCAICLESSIDYDADWYECDTCTSQSCTKCLAEYLHIQTGESKSLCCPDPSCESRIPETIVRSLVDAGRLDQHKKHMQMKEDANLRECPHCGILNKGSADAPDMVCSGCSGEFCFLHDIQHAGKRCKKQHRGSGGILSAMYLRTHTTKCPGCKAPVQRSSGCPHMQCTKCNTDFCYHCGKATPAGTTYMHRKLWTMQCHSARSWTRRAGVIVAAPVVAGAVVAAGGIAIGLSPIAVPLYIGSRKRRSGFRR